MNTLFHVTGLGTFPQDHGYKLLCALSMQVPFLHGRSDIQIAPMTGRRLPDNRISLDNRSRLLVRGIDNDERTQMMGFRGETFRFAHSDRLYFRAADTLSSRLVVYKDTPFEDGVVGRSAFLLRVLKNLEAIVNQNDVRVTLFRQRGLRVKGFTLLGCSVTLSNLTVESSLAIQACGLGHGTSMGCGVFQPASTT